MTMDRFNTTRFGEISFDSLDVVTFPEGLAGFTAAKRFVFVQHREGSPFRWMQSLDDPALAFLVVDPNHYVAEYSPEMPASAAKKLQLGPETPLLVYTMASIPSGRPEAMTLNLAGPIAVNAETRTALQIVLEGDGWSVRHSVFGADGSQAA
ncbi:MAG: flagellar assembly protein FliW [Fimbriimonadaceae bacterium]|nr:flagellar assembly protein FliW [Fimbriimonadaceae bacterium]